MPHVWATPVAAPFAGVADNVREYSVVFPERTLGFTLGRCAAEGDADFPAFVASTEAPDCPTDVRVGDLLSKISGKTAAALKFDQCIAAIKHSQRPIMLHFLATLGAVQVGFLGVPRRSFGWGRDPVPQADPLHRAPGGAGDANPFLAARPAPPATRAGCDDDEDPFR